MSKTSKTVVFFGSGPVAAASLALLHQHTAIEAVITKPQPSHHRDPFPVLETAKQLGLTVLTASNKAELSALLATKPVLSQLAVLIDYGIIVGQDVIDYFQLGIINSHFSILPELRGPDPISHAILSGQTSTGVSLMLLVAVMDEGPLIAYRELPLNGHETTTSLTASLIDVSDTLLRQSLPNYRNQPQSFPQSITGRQVSYTRNLTKTDGIIDWQKSAVQVEREIRAFIEWPKSRTSLNGIDVIITKARVLPGANGSTTTPGNVTIMPESKQLVIGCGDGGMLVIEQLKPAGKADMTAAAFITGYGNRLI
jgi:methionyl-tRNA formyltransferase